MAPPSIADEHAFFEIAPQYAPNLTVGYIHLGGEVVGVIANFVFVFVVMYVFFKLLDKVVPLRVSEELEIEGLDQTEVAVSAYPDFNIKKAIW